MTDTLGFLKELRRMSWRGSGDKELPSRDLPQHAWEHVHVALLERKYSYDNVVVCRGAYRASVGLEMLACGKNFTPDGGVVDLSSFYFLTRHLFVLPVGCKLVIDGCVDLTVHGEPMALLLSGVVDIRISQLGDNVLSCANADQTHLVRRLCDTLKYVIEDVEDVLSSASHAPISYLMLPNRISKDVSLYWNGYLHPYTDFLLCSPDREEALRRVYALSSVAAYVACGGNMEPGFTVGAVEDTGFDTVIAVGPDSVRLPVKPVSLQQFSSEHVKLDISHWLKQQLGVAGMQAKSVLRVEVDPGRHIDCAKDVSGHTLDEPMLSVLSPGDVLTLGSRTITVDKPTVFVVHGHISLRAERRTDGALWFLPLRFFSHTVWHKRWIRCRKKIFDMSSQVIWTDVQKRWDDFDVDVRQRSADVDVVEVIERYYSVAYDLYKSMKPTLEGVFEPFG